MRIREALRNTLGQIPIRRGERVDIKGQSVRITKTLSGDYRIKVLKIPAPWRRTHPVELQTQSSSVTLEPGQKITVRKGQSYRLSVGSGVI